jgi:hypothetical protein
MVSWVGFFNFSKSNIGSGSGTRIWNPDPLLKGWNKIRFRIRIKSMRIRNPGIRIRFPVFAESGSGDAGSEPNYLLIES